MHSKGEAVVAPIIINDCKWEDIGISKLIALPKDRKPIKRHGNRDEAYTYITDQIKTRAQLINTRPEYINRYLNQSDKTLSLIRDSVIWLSKATASTSLIALRGIITLFSSIESTQKKSSKKKDIPALPIIIAVGTVAFFLSYQPTQDAGPVASQYSISGYSTTAELEEKGVDLGYLKTIELNPAQQMWCTDEKNLKELHAKLNCRSGFIWDPPKK